MSIRRITFGGNLTADPEVRQAGGNTVCNFSIACDDYQGGQEVTDFIDCDAWGKVGQSIADNFKRAAGSSYPGLLAGSAIPPRRAKNERLSGCV